MPYGANAAVDALRHGLDNALAEAGVELRLLYADFARPRLARPRGPRRSTRASRPGSRRSCCGSSTRRCRRPRSGRARAAGIPVVTLERPQFAVDASVVYPNFNHGVYMSEYLATLLPPGARVAVVGGPDVVDDIELMLGLLHGLDTAGLDPGERSRGPPVQEHHRRRVGRQGEDGEHPGRLRPRWTG